MSLFRVPNLLTVPGDAVAGFLLALPMQAAVHHGLWLAPLAGLLLYLGGLALNDVADLDEDRRLRPHRPLAAGHLPVRLVVAVGGLLIVGGVAAAWSLGLTTRILVIMLACSVISYTFWTKSVPLLGPLNMGACRGLNLLVGAAAVGGRLPAPVWVAAALLVTYIMAVSLLARREAEPRSTPTAESWLPPVILLLGAWYFVGRMPPGLERWACLAAFGLALLAVLSAALRIGILASRGGVRATDLRIREQLKRDLPRLTGHLIGALLALQAGLVFAAGEGVFGLQVGLSLLVLWPVNRVLARWFYAS